MNIRNMKFAGTLLLGLLMATATEAQHHQGGRGSGPGRAGEGVGYRLAWLDLTEAQQEEISALRTEHYKEITPLRNKMSELRARERTLLSEEDVNIKAVEKNIDEQTGLLNNIRKVQTKHRLSVQNILSDEQLMKLQQGRHFTHRNAFHGNRGPRAKHGMFMNRGYRMDRYHRMDRDRPMGHPYQMKRGHQYQEEILLEQESDLDQGTVVFQKI